MLQIYCGNGKGKTTASIGLAVRAAGAGLRVLFFQFMKNGSSSEIAVLRSISNINVYFCEECRTFTKNLIPEELATVKNKHDHNLEIALNMINSNSADLVILDEFISAFNKGLLDTELALSLIRLKDKCEIVLTGRDPDERLVAVADYISEINCVRHPFEKGIQARKGIEY